ncbi:MAG: beta-ketoacyl synthase N-terminal-like domain-containing protein, partial [Candidatus Marinimicrobia bacterium]|nr:beta-ketoacyl synthase N-terminal-like domain-containing protein [Candidatus Neomarinimicrobiota bacterium]
MTNQEIVIVSATRTALGTFGGSLSSIPAPKLGAEVISALLKDTGIQGDQVDEVILGQVLTAGSGQNPARQSALSAGLPETTPAMTINKVCGSGLKAVQLAFQAVACGDAEIVIAGGQENMSLSSHVLPNSRDGKKMGPWGLVDSMVVDGLWCAFNNYHMGTTAENIAEKYNYSRDAQDQFAAKSQQKAEAAQKSGLFDNEITAVNIPQRRGDDIVFDTDEFPRHGT